MNFLIFMLKVILMPALVCLMAAPLFLEYLSFRKDRDEGISHKRFRLLAFSVVYFLVITIVMVLLKDLLVWIRGWRFVVWLCNQLAVPARVDYAADVFAVILLNFGIGLLFELLLKLVRIGLKKSDPFKAKENGSFTLWQKAEQWILKKVNHEKWFLAARILLILCLSLSAVYSILFLSYQLPIFFGANWIPYTFLTQLFEAGYLYPVITLIPLCQAYFFLAGVEAQQDKYPELKKDKQQTTTKEEPDLQKVNEKTKEIFKDYFRHQITLQPAGNTDPAETVSATGHHEITMQIAEGVKNDRRNTQHIVQEGFLGCIDAIVENDFRTVIASGDEKPGGVLINGGFFTEFAMYFLRYVSVILARGDNVVFVCSDDQQINSVHDCVRQAFCQMYSLYPKDTIKDNLSFDDPIWKLCKITSETKKEDEALLDACSVLVTDLEYLCSEDFGKNHVDFVNLIDTVVFVDTMASVNTCARQMTQFVAIAKNLREQNALRAKNSVKKVRSDDGLKDKSSFDVCYTYKQLKYICFDDSRVPGLDKVLNNLLSVEFETADAMKYVPETIICCYNYERGPNEEGIKRSPTLALTSEDLGVLANMADHVIAVGGQMVSLFARQNIPYADVRESLKSNANSGVLVKVDHNLQINKPFYNTDDYNVIVAFDEEDNLPAMVRRYAAMVPEKPTLVLLFSRPYLFRDYFVDNIEELWRVEQLMRIPVVQSTRRHVAEEILIRANTGGISGEEIIRVLKDEELVDPEEVPDRGGLDAILRKLLMDCGVPQNEALELDNFFEYHKCREFDKDGQFVSKDKICLRKRGALYAYINSLDRIRLLAPGEEMYMHLPKDRITQNFIEGQNLLHNGKLYTVRKINTSAGTIRIQRATGGRNNIPYQYLQEREYFIDWSEEAAQGVYPSGSVSLRDIDGDVQAKEAIISVKRRPMEVVTKGYTPVDPLSLARNGAENEGHVSLMDKAHEAIFWQCYRKYGEIETPVFNVDSVVGNERALQAYPNGALVMSVRITGNFGENAARISNLAAAMLGELLHTMFPTVADSLAVCPVVSKRFEDKDSECVLGKQYKAVCRGREPAQDEVEVLIIEDCPGDLGVISVLMSSGDDPLKMLFTPLHQYLTWYAETEEKSNYLFYGLESEPACFDIAGLTKIASQLSDPNARMEPVDETLIIEYDTCDFCGRRFAKGNDVTMLPDGRRMCKDCGATLVGNDKKTLKDYLDRARMYLESVYGITLGDDYDVCFESTVKIANTLKQTKEASRRGADLPFKSYVDDQQKLHVEYELPPVNLSELLVRELTHVWQLKNLPNLEEDLAEGHIALVGIQYLRFLNEHRLATVRATYYESARNVAGEGYRKLITALVDNPSCNNNPFRYLMLGVDTPTQTIVVPPVRRNVKGFYGLPYTSQTPDRALDGNIRYFFYERLTTSKKKAYDILLEAIRNHQETIRVECSFEDMAKVSRAVQSDHPELFWYNNFEMYEQTGQVNLLYGASVEECEVLQRRLDEVMPKYLEGIDDSMSAYDVAIRLHVKLINAVDYDTLALQAEEVDGYPKSDEIDSIRSICGVFLDGRAVCAGYARAMQYLLHKCGVECAYASGLVRKENGQSGGGHGWNILKVDGEYYYLDTTWDDSSDTVQTVKNRDFGFDYFCITTDELTRTRDLSRCPTDMPPCTAIRANYYYHNGAVMDTYDPELLKTLAQKAAQDQQEFFSFKCTSRKLYEEALTKVCTDGKDTFAALKLAAKINKKISSTYFGYGYNNHIWTITVRFKMK